MVIYEPIINWGSSYEWSSTIVKILGYITLNCHDQWISWRENRLTGNQPDFPMISMGLSCNFSQQNQSIEKGNYRVNQENCGYFCDHFWRTSLEVGAQKNCGHPWPSNDTCDWLNKLQEEKADWWTDRHLALIGDELQLLPWNSAWHLEVPPQLTLQHDGEILPSTEQAIENSGEFQWN